MISEALLIALPFIGQAADVATTEHGIRRGLYETNPAAWAQDTGQRRAVKAGVGLAMSGLMYGLKRRGVSKRVRVAMSLVAAATGLVPAVINVSRTH